MIANRFEFLCHLKVTDATKSAPVSHFYKDAILQIIIGLIQTMKSICCDLAIQYMYGKIIFKEVVQKKISLQSMLLQPTGITHPNFFLLQKSHLPITFPKRYHVFRNKTFGKNYQKFFKIQNLQQYALTKGLLCCLGLNKTIQDNMTFR